MNLITRALRAVLTSEEAAAAVCIDCSDLKGTEYKCQGGKLWYRTYVTYGCRCQNRAYSAWKQTMWQCPGK